MHEIFAIADDARFQHLAHQVIALTRTLSYTGKNRDTIVSLGNIVDKLLNKYRLTNTGTTKQTNLTPFEIRLNQVNNFDTRIQYLFLRRQLLVGRWFAVDRTGISTLRHVADTIDSFPNDIEEATFDPLTDGHGDRCTGVDNFRTA